MNLNQVYSSREACILAANGYSVTMFGKSLHELRSKVNFKGKTVKVSSGNTCILKCNGCKFYVRFSKSQKKSETPENPANCWKINSYDPLHNVYHCLDCVGNASMSNKVATNVLNNLLTPTSGSGDDTEPRVVERYFSLRPTKRSRNVTTVYINRPVKRPLNCTGPCTCIREEGMIHDRSRATFAEEDLWSDYVTYGTPKKCSCNIDTSDDTPGICVDLQSLYNQGESATPTSASAVDSCSEEVTAATLDRDALKRLSTERARVQGVLTSLMQKYKKLRSSHPVVKEFNHCTHQDFVNRIIPSNLNYYQNLLNSSLGTSTANIESYEKGKLHGVQFVV